MNLPNLITLSRVPMLFIVVELMFSRLQWTDTAAFVVFVIGGITDWLDGFLARRYRQVSTFGKLMDALTDKVLIVGILIAMLVPMPGNEIPGTGMQYPILPSWAVFFVILIMAREFLVTGLRLVAISQGVVLAAERSGKLKTILQFVSISVLLLTSSLNHDFMCSDAVVSGWSLVGMMLFLASALLAAASGFGYLAKYWGMFTGRVQLPAQK
ncbi:MAG: CDP-alcohol phosphatidyltransferase family protein [Opitutales bacterium]